jgi:hypothetical protein
MTVLIMILSSLVLLLSLALLILRQKLVAVSELMRMARGSSKFYHEAYLEMIGENRKLRQEPLRQALSMAETEARKMKNHLDYYVKECVDLERLIKLKDEELNAWDEGKDVSGAIKFLRETVRLKTRQLAETQEALRRAEERLQAMSEKILQVEAKPHEGSNK